VYQQFGTAISPDGRFVVFAARGNAGPSLWLRPLDSLTARELPGTENGNGPFWSPDSKSIGFVSISTNKLQRIDLVGGSARLLADAPNFEGGSWSQDGVILFSTAGILQRIPAAGGTVTPVTMLDAARKAQSHRYPHFLPDGRTFLFLIRSADPIVEGIYAATLDQPTPGRRLVATNAKAVYVPPYSGRPGQLLWIRDQTLMAQSFDVSRLKVEGEPAAAVDGVLENNARRAAFWVSNNGLLAYRSGGAGNLQPTWVSKDGKERQPVVPAADNYPDVRLSPDATEIALSKNTVNNEDLFVFDIGRGVMSRLTFDAGRDFSPVWSPDGRQLAFTSDRDGLNQMYRKDAAGGQEERMQKSSTPQTVLDWSRDGRYLLYQDQNPKTGRDLWVLPLQGDRKPIPFLATPFNESNATFSPDGKWIAYTSDESSRNEVYLRSFPSSPVQWQVSSNAGIAPRWRGDGSELYYRTPDSVFSVAVHTGPQGLQMDSPRALFQWSGPNSWDVNRAGDRFLLLAPPGLNEGSGGGVLSVISNWQATLRR
jgi:Tol biopolymer transport system component